MLGSYDVAIVGGSHAGLSAALILGRARRSVIVIDAGEPRNAAAERAHGFSTHDGTPPADLRRLGREELVPYGVTVVEARVEQVTGHDLDFILSLDSGQVSARKLVLATGVQDDLSVLPGLRDLWGHRAYSCPYCHGWEVRDKPLAVIGQGEMGVHYAAFVRNWSKQVTLCSNGEALEPQQQARLRQLGLHLIDKPITALSGTQECAVVDFNDGSQLVCEGIFIHPPTQLPLALLRGLGCALSEDESYVETDARGQTSVPGVYAVGDLASAAPAIVLAAASGANAAYMLNHQFVFEQQAALLEA